MTLTNHGIEGQALISEQSSPLVNTSPSEASLHSVHFGETAVNNATGVVLSEAYVPAGQTISVMAEKTLDISLLDERSLLACVVRTIPPGGRIRISSTVGGICKLTLSSS